MCNAEQTLAMTSFPESGNLVKQVSLLSDWIPAFAGMTFYFVDIAVQLQLQHTLANRQI